MPPQAQGERGSGPRASHASGSPLEQAVEREQLGTAARQQRVGVHEALVVRGGQPGGHSDVHQRVGQQQLLGCGGEGSTRRGKRVSSSRGVPWGIHQRVAQHQLLGCGGDKQGPGQGRKHAWEQAHVVGHVAAPHATYMAACANLTLACTSHSGKGRHARHWGERCWPSSDLPAHLAPPSRARPARPAPAAWPARPAGCAGPRWPSPGAGRQTVAPARPAAQGGGAAARKRPGRCAS